MSDLLFTIQVFASVTALIASYAFLMAILNKEPKVVWLRGTAVLMLLASGISFGLYYTNLFDLSNLLAFASASLLWFTVLVSLILVITHRLEMKNDGAVYPERLIPVAKIVAMVCFASITGHLLFQTAALAWG